MDANIIFFLIVRINLCGILIFNFLIFLRGTKFVFCFFLALKLLFVSEEKGTKYLKMRVLIVDAS
jgi:hypothetical protein